MGVGMQVISFFTLVAVQSTAILLFKLAQHNGAYRFSPASSVALTELMKLALALGSHAVEVRATGADFFPSSVSAAIIMHYFGLACLYTVNNILTFYVLELADPGTLSLFKSMAPYLCALLLRLSGQVLNRLQWCCVVIQCCAIAIIQYDIKKGMPLVSLTAYALLVIATSITAASSVWNQLVIKGFSVPLNLQNAILYSFGALLSIAIFIWKPTKEEEKGFFEGYGWLAMGLIFFQALHGLAVSFVYKHADAIVKNFANSSVMAVLVVISAYFFGLEMNVHAALAVIIVIVTTYIYMGIATAPPAPPPSSTASQYPSEPKESKKALVSTDTDDEDV